MHADYSRRVFTFGEKYPVAGRSLLLFVLDANTKELSPRKQDAKAQ